MSKDKKKIDPVVILLDAIIITMVFVIIYSCVVFKFHSDSAKKFSSFMQEPDMMSFELSNNNYAALIQGKYINEINGNTESESYHMLANYAEAASKYKIYNKKEYVERATEQKAIMDEARQGMKDLTIFADRIDKMFGIE